MQPDLILSNVPERRIVIQNTLPDLPTNEIRDSVESLGEYSQSPKNYLTTIHTGDIQTRRNSPNSEIMLSADDVGELKVPPFSVPKLPVNHGYVKKIDNPFIKHNIPSLT